MTNPYFIMTWDKTLSRKVAQAAQEAIDAIDPSVELMANMCIPGSDVRMWLSRPNDGTNEYDYQDAKNRRCVEIVEELLRNPRQAGRNET